MVKYSLLSLILLQIVLIRCEVELMVPTDEFGLTASGARCRVIRVFKECNQTNPAINYENDLNVTDTFVEHYLNLSNQYRNNDTNEIACYLNLDTATYNLVNFTRIEFLFDNYMEVMRFEALAANNSCSSYTLKRFCYFGKNNFVGCKTDMHCNDTKKNEWKLFSSQDVVVIIVAISSETIIIGLVLAIRNIHLKNIDNKISVIADLRRQLAELKTDGGESEKLNGSEKSDLKKLLENCV